MTVPGARTRHTEGSTMLKVLIIATCLALAACGPPCEERGGKTELLYIMPIVHPNGLVTLVPVFDCKGVKE